MWFRNTYRPIWRQAVAIEMAEVLPVLIAATGQAVVAANMLIHHDQNPRTKLKFLGRVNEPVSENLLDADEKFYLGKDNDDLPRGSVKLIQLPDDE